MTNIYSDYKFTGDEVEIENRNMLDGSVQVMMKFIRDNNITLRKFTNLIKRVHIDDSYSSYPVNVGVWAIPDPKERMFFVLRFKGYAGAA